MSTATVFGTTVKSASRTLSVGQKDVGSSLVISLRHPGVGASATVYLYDPYGIQIWDGSVSATNPDLDASISSPMVTGQAVSYSVVVDQNATLPTPGLSFSISGSPASPSDLERNPTTGALEASGPIVARRIIGRSLRVVSIGDSIVLNGGGVAGAMCSQSGFACRFVFNGGVGGDTTAMILARMPTIMSYAPDIAVISCGYNDTGTNAEFAANLNAIIDLVIAGNALPILLTHPPTTAAALVKVQGYNAMLQNIAYRRGILCSYRWRAVNDGTFQYKAGTSADNIHPNTYLLAAEGAGLLADMKAAGIVLNPISYREESNTTGLNKITVNGLMLTDSNADGLADNVSNFGSGSPVFTLVPGEFGNKQVATISSSNGTIPEGISVNFGNPSVVGATYIMRAIFTVACDTGEVNCAYSNSGAQFVPQFPRVKAGTPLRYEMQHEFISQTTGSKSLAIYSLNSTATNTVITVEQVQLYLKSAIE